jgi:cytosine/adenosine deaminase-related metal-dependent hydrolase
MQGVHELSEAKGVNIHTHAYAGHVAAAAAAFPDILSPKLTLAHCAGISIDEVGIMAETEVNATHGPLTHAFASARFPVTEALEAGVNVAISTDGSGPDRSFDLLAQGRIAAQLQRAYFADTSIMPAGKILEMMTIDAARALGMEDEIGSLEVGKQADIIALNLHSARMSPRLMLLERVVYVGSGLDVEFMMVDGRILMHNREIQEVDIDQIIADANQVARDTYARAGQLDKLASHPHAWGHVRYS